MTVLKTNDALATGDSVRTSHNKPRLRMKRKLTRTLDGKKYDVAGASDAPPPYPSPPLSSSASSASGYPPHRRTSSTQSNSRMKMPNVPPTNFLIIKRDNNSIRESIIIDPSLPILDPDAELKPEEERKNLFVESKNGSVNMDVWLVDGMGTEAGSSEGGSKRTVVDIGSKNGSVTVLLVRLPSSTYPFLNKWFTTSTI